MVSRRYMAAMAAASVLLISGCGESLDQILIPIPDESEQATLVDFSGGDLTQPSAFDILSEDVVRTDQSAGWDFVLELLPDDTPVLWPRSGLVEDDSDSGIYMSSNTFDGLTEAPETGYVQTEFVIVQEGDVLAVRSRRDPVFGNIRCRRFAKIEILAVDSAEGTATFRFLVNPNCEKRKLVAGADE